MSAPWGIIHESGGYYDYAAKEPHSMANRARPFRSEEAARRTADMLTREAGRGAYHAVQIVPWVCPLCAQRIADGKPCGCGARK